MRRSRVVCRCIEYRVGNRHWGDRPNQYNLYCASLHFCSRLKRDKASHAVANQCNTLESEMIENFDNPVGHGLNGGQHVAGRSAMAWKIDSQDIEVMA